ncbi:MAG: response regulator [Bacteroidetes bacterium]|nr:MAG: response regulator [Bacteroidota bacterium]
MLKKIKILLMDAEKNSCEEMQEFLQREGFNVLTAHSAAEGKLVLQEMPIDILILDIRLPDANGLEVLKENKSRYPKLDVIVISGHGDMDSVIQAMHLGALDFLRKPLRLMDLRSAIERSQKIQINDIAIFLPNEKNPLSCRPLVKIVGR